MNRLDPLSTCALASRPVNVCTSTLTAFTLDDALKLAAASGHEGIELRVHGNGHIGLQDLQRRCGEVFSRDAAGGRRRYGS